MGKNGKDKDLARMKELSELLRAASKAYYQDAEEIMSNFEYDMLYDELVELEKRTGTVLAGSPTQRVGYEVVSALPKVRHPEPMKSLDKTKEIDELIAWMGSQDALLSWKLDGLTCVLTYENGRLVQAATRGNGEVGEDITPNAKCFKEGVPLQIPYTGRLTVRGEAIISYPEFERVNRELEADAQYKNPRNLCSGSVRQLNSAVTATRGVSLIVYLAIPEDDGIFEDSKEKSWAFLKEQGFTVVDYARVNAGTLRDAVADFTARVPDFVFPVDGLVLTYDSLSYAASLGSTAKFPRHSIAFKWQDENADTHIDHIEWSPSRTGAINPVAVFDPVELEGTTVRRASVHNVSMMEELQLGVGDLVSVYKANMIIPQISENKTRSGPAPCPDACPRCGGRTEIRIKENAKVLYCTNPACPAKSLMSLVHFVSRQAMNIDGLSEMTLAKFLEMDYINTFADLYRLGAHRAQIAELEGFGEKSCEKILAAVEKSKDTELWRVLSGIGIPGVGEAGAKVLAKRFKTPEALIAADTAEIAAIDGFGDILAQGVADFFAPAENRAMLADLLSYLNLKEEAAEESAQNLAGLTFVITGSLNTYENRDALKAVIEARGGKVSGSVSKNTSYLINNDIASNSSKNKTAKELGVPIIDEAAFNGQFLL